MPIKVACHCGQSFTAKDDLAGQTLLCPKCSQPLTIPSPNARAQAQQLKPADSMADLFDEVGLKEYRGARCPKCNAPLKPDAVLCTECGFHLQSGQILQGAKVYKAGERGHAEATDTLLERAAKQIEIDKVELKKSLSQGLPAWMYFLALTALSAFVITMFMIPREKAFLISGYSLWGFAMLMEFYYYVRQVMVAFSESTACGLMFVLLPVYPLYYLITRWDKIGTFFLLQLGFTIVIFFGMVMVALAPMMKKDKEASYNPSWPTQPHYVAVAQFEPGIDA